MQNTDGIAYPVIIYGKYGMLEYYSRPDELVLVKRQLKLYNSVEWIRLIDAELNLYKVVGYQQVRGSGPLSGFFFVGPFLQRRVVFRAELKFLQQITQAEVGEVFVNYFRKAEGISRREKTKFEESLARFISGGSRSLAELYEFFRVADDRPLKGRKKSCATLVQNADGQ